MDGSGAFWFGLVIGWFTYFTMRHKKEHAITDIASVIGAVGGAAVLSLFPQNNGLFGNYACGLAIGFFAYLVLALLIVLFSKEVSFRDFLFGTNSRPGMME